MPATHVQFTPAASTLLTVSNTPQTVELPPVDPAAPAVVLHNLGPGAVAVVPGAPSGQVFHAFGAVLLHDGEMMLSLHPGMCGGTLAKMQAQGGLPVPGEQPHPRAGLPTQVTVTRGSLAEVWMFPAPAAAVI